MQPFDLSPLRPPSIRLKPDPDRLQGWETPWLYDLKAPHRLPALLELELLHGNTPSGQSFAIRGPAVTIGRYTAETGPVDIDLGVLAEHERMRIGLPHVRIGRDLEGWRIEPMTAFFPTLLSGQALEPSGVALQEGNVLTLGDVHFLVHYGRQADKALAVERPEPPCLRLKRDGALTGTNIPLSSHSMTFGRSSPLTGDVDCDLSDLPDNERVCLGRQHARFFMESGRWFVEPIGRAPVFINRQSALEQTHALMNGDEIALGNVLFNFMGTALLDGLPQEIGESEEP